MVETGKRLRVLIGSIGLDGHELGALIVSRALQNAGIEVVYLGLNLTPEEVVEAAIQEDVDIIGISSMSGIHIEALSDLIRLLKEKGVDNIPVITGGIIPPEDIPILKKIGVKGVFPAGTPTEKIINFIRNELSLKG